MVNCGHGVAVVVPPTRLDFDEGNRVPALDDEINVAMARPETTVHDRPAAGQGPPSSHALAPGAELLPLCKHGGKVP